MLTNQFPEVILSNKKMANKIARELKKGNIRKIGPRLYTTNLKDSPEYIIKKHLWVIVSEYFPDGLITDRTALENVPAKDGSIFLISERKREVLLPGYTLKPRIGIPAQESDYPFISRLKICSQARAFLENMRPSRMRGKISRALSQKEIEEKLEKVLVGGGEKALNKLREEAKSLAIKLHLEDEYKKLEMLIGTLLGTKEAALLSEITISRTKGQPYDSKRVDLFQTLYAALKNLAPQQRLRLNPTEEARINLAFFEAYFSNFIEGTEFEVTEASDIIFKGRISRIMMNGELLKANEYPIIIPIIYRNNYLSSLKALSHHGMSEPLIRTMDFAQKYVASIDWSDFKNATEQLVRTNAFYDPNTADLEGIRLRIE